MPLTIGDPAPWFTLPSTSNPAYHFESVGGFRVILCFLGSSRMERSRQVIQEFAAIQQDLAARSVPFFGVCIDPPDDPLVNLVQEPTYFKLLWDGERRVSRLYDVCWPESQNHENLRYAPTTYVLDESLRVIGTFPIERTDDHVAQVVQFIDQLPPLPTPTVAVRQAPVLFIPNVFDQSLCRHLIQLYEADGGHDSGFMRQVDGKTVEVFDYAFKQRRDLLIQDPELLEQINTLILRRVKPEIEKAFQFSITRFERHLVACYEAETQGFFNRHRDNTTKGTAHRRFAMTLNLNAGEYEGGYLRFPEFGPHLYRPTSGEAVIFSCSLLHEVSPVIKGRRFTLLSFFYNDDDARVREQNRKYVVLNQPENRLEPSATSTTPSKPQKGFQPKSGKKKR